MIIEKTERGTYLVTVEGGIITNANTDRIIPSTTFEIEQEPVLVEREERIREWTYGTEETIISKYKSEEVEFIVTHTLFHPELGNTHSENHETIKFTKGEEKVKILTFDDIEDE